MSARAPSAKKISKGPDLKSLKQPVAKVPQPDTRASDTGSPLPQVEGESKTERNIPHILVAEETPDHTPDPTPHITQVPAANPHIQEEWRVEEHKKDDKRDTPGENTPPAIPDSAAVPTQKQHSVPSIEIQEPLGFDPTVEEDSDQEEKQEMMAWVTNGEDQDLGQARGILFKRSLVARAFAKK